MSRAITRTDILDPATYEQRRAELRARNVERKKARRVHVGPFATFHFESRDTMWMQIHEMLRIEKGGEAQIDGELEAYNPLVPQGHELTATMMLEIEDPQHRAVVLARLGHIDESITLFFAGETVKALPVNPEEDRTTPEGKTSSIHFLRFVFAPEQIARFRTPGTQVVLAFAHPDYAHAAVMPEAVRAALAEDFD
ncbi:MAG: DUF3501 family protein [Alphaproteobacteria bacterium]|nr:DUF3501 family protein [Alphaproteobacteria bacterium]